MPAQCVFQLDPQTLQEKDWQRTVIFMNGVRQSIRATGLWRFSVIQVEFNQNIRVYICISHMPSKV